MGTATPPGWYEDPTDPANLRYWDGKTWTEHVSGRREPAAVPTGGVNWVAGGIVIAALGLTAAVVSFLFALLTANACGMFADGCDDYGEPAPGFALFVASTIVAGGAAVGGVLVAVTATARRRRANHPHG
jgi:hypothetical protein